MSSSKKQLFWGIVVAQVAVIALLMFFKMVVLSGGTPVLLHIAPVDPTDPLRGDYVTFRYDITNLDKQDIRVWGDVSLTEKYYVGQEVFVPLSPDRWSKYWKVNGPLLLNMSERYRSDQVYLKGTIKSVRTDRVTISYGLEEYFIPEGTGRTMRFWNHDVSALVYVADNGESVLKQLYLDDEPWP